MRRYLFLAFASCDCVHGRQAGDPGQGATSAAPSDAAPADAGFASTPPLRKIYGDCRDLESEYVRRASAEHWALMETFDAGLDHRIWAAAIYPWPENGCVMNASTIAVRDGVATLTVRRRAGESSGSPSGKDNSKICVGAEIYTVRFFPHAHATACLRTEATPGTVAAFYAISRWQAPVWHQQEIDFEWMGNDLRTVQLNIHDHTRPPDTNLEGNPTLYPLEFSADGGFHRYEFEWDGKSTRFSVEGVVVATRVEDTPTLPLNIVLNHYVVTPTLSWATAWAGEFQDGSLPTTTVVDWVAVQELP